MPRVSVIIPTYNRADLVAEAIDSVLTQSYCDLEVIVVDDGSTDNTAEVIKQYGQRIRVVRQQNAGEPLARNAGIRVASGEFVCFLDSDDIWMPSKLVRQVEVLEREPDLAWVYSDAFVFYGTNRQPAYLLSQACSQFDGAIGARLLLADFIPLSTLIVRRTVLDEVGWFAELPRGPDWDLWLRIAARYPVRRLADPLVGYRVHEGSLSELQSIELKHRWLVEVIERAILFAPSVYQPYRARALAAQYVRTGRVVAVQGNGAEAREYFLQAARLTPAWHSPWMHWAGSLLGRRQTALLASLARRARESRFSRRQQIGDE